MKTTSYIIPVFNGETHIGRCLEHIEAERAPQDEIIVVDNGSTDQTQDIVRTFTHVRLLVHPGITIAALRNRGAEAASGDILAFIDSDCLVCRGWRQTMEDVLKDDTIGATGSICDIPDNATWVERAWWSFRHEQPAEVSYINSGNFVIRGDLFRSIGGFKEQLHTDEDTEISARVRERQLRLLDHPGIRVIHLGNAKTIGQFISKERWHATSILHTVARSEIDKAMLMTVLFALTVALTVFLCIRNLLEGSFLLWPLLLILTAPILTAIFRVVHYRTYRYFFYFIPLYFIFYSVRSITIIESLLKRR